MSCLFRRSLAGAVSCITVAVLMLAPAAEATELRGVRMHEAPEYTRVVFDISGPVDYELFSLADPARVVIDLAGTSAGQGRTRLHAR